MTGRFLNGAQAPWRAFAPIKTAEFVDRFLEKP
jgi:hypothetical protein